MMIDEAILPAIYARLAAALATPSIRYRPLIVDGTTLGWLDDARASRLASFRTVFRVGIDSISIAETLRDCDWRSAALADVIQALRDQGEFPAWRNELYAVAPTFGVPPVFLLERGAARWFGVRTWAVHVNGIVGEDAASELWFARRSPDKGIDPGRLDNLVGGGITAGARVGETLIKEAWEEAGIAADVARHAQPAGAVHVRRMLPDGLQRETIFVHDLALSRHFVPINQDGEAVEHRRVDLYEAARLLAVESGPDEVTVDASLVVLDFVLRRGVIAPDASNYLALEGLRFLGAEATAS
jgi:8-oxo-dGTP pyrophosphatase MutT (NUDIX family)